MSTESRGEQLSFGERLRDARKLRALTQGRLAGLVGVTDATFSRYEKGELIPPSNVLAKIVRVLQSHSSSEAISADFLLFGGPTDAGESTTAPRLRQFGAVVGMLFGHEGVALNGGYCEVSVGSVDIASLLGVLVNLESNCERPRRRVLSALQLVTDSLFEQHVDFELLLEVPIAQYGVRLVPKFPDELGALYVDAHGANRGSAEGE